MENAKFITDVIITPFHIFFNLFAPESDDSPPILFEYFVNFAIPLDITLDLRDPVFAIGMDFVFSVFPIITVPEFAVAENGYFFPDEYDIRVARYEIAILPVPDTSGPEFFSQQQFY